MIDDLLRNPQGFNLFQAISLLERVAAGEGAQGMEALDAVRLRGQVSLGFCPSDVSAVVREADTGEPFCLTTPVLSLAGAGGPLPLAVTELLLERRARRDHATADFLDIFNHRFLTFLYRARRKAHVSLSGARPGSATLTDVLDATHALGLAAARRAPDAPVPWLRHAALLGGATRSMAGLEAMLRDRLGLHVEGAQMVGGWIQAEPRVQLRLPAAGAPASQAVPCLGRSLVLGKRVWDQGAGIRLRFSGLGRARLQALLPGAPDHRCTQWLVRRYLPQEMDVRLELHATGHPLAGGSVLSAKNPMRLGWTTWLAGPRYRGSFAPVRLKLPAASSRI